MSWLYVDKMFGGGRGGFVMKMAWTVKTERHDSDLAHSNQNLNISIWEVLKLQFGNDVKETYLTWKPFHHRPRKNTVLNFLSPWPLQTLQLSSLKREWHTSPQVFISQSYTHETQYREDTRPRSLYVTALCCLDVWLYRYPAISGKNKLDQDDEESSRDHWWKPLQQQ